MCIWKVMADSFDFDDIEITQLVYQNYPVKRFMDAKQSMGISACKGMGKTLNHTIKSEVTSSRYAQVSALWNI